MLFAKCTPSISLSQDDLNYIETLIGKNFSWVFDLQPRLTFTNNPWPTVKHIEDVMLFKPGENNSDLILIKFLTFCDGLSVPKTVNSSTDENYAPSEVTNFSKCNDVFGELRTNLSSLIVRDLKRMKLKSMELEYQKYYTFMENIPLTLNTSVYHGRQKCWSYEDEIIYLDNLLNDIIKLAANISDTNSFSEAYKCKCKWLNCTRRECNTVQQKYLRCILM